MKYFTSKLWSEISGWNSEVASKACRSWDGSVKAYEVQFQQVLPPFSKRNQVFWKKYVYDLHDGPLIRITVGDAVEVDILGKLPKSWRTSATIEVIDWGGHWLYTLKYRSIQTIDANFVDSELTSGTIFEDWGYSELLQEEEGVFRHSILFPTGSEISIVFKGFNYSRKKLSNKSSGRRR